MRRLDRLELPEQRVELGVGDLRVVEQVVPVVVVLDLLAQRGGPCCRIGVGLAAHVIGGRLTVTVGCVVTGGAVVTGAAVVGAPVVGAAVVGAVAPDVGAKVLTVAIVVVGGVSSLSLLNTKTTSRITAATMTAEMTMTAERCQPCQLVSRSSSRFRRGGAAPGPLPYARVGSPGSDGYAMGGSSGGMRIRSLRSGSRD